MADFNPIEWVNGEAIPCPSSYQWEIEDISDANAGRTEALKMDKNKIGSIVKLELEWQNVTNDIANQVLRAFKDEYFTVRYYDLAYGTYVTKEFYCGNRTAPMYSHKLGIWKKLAFNIIERSGL